MSQIIGRKKGKKKKSSSSFYPTSTSRSFESGLHGEDFVLHFNTNDDECYGHFLPFTHFTCKNLCVCVCLIVVSFPHVPCFTQDGFKKANSCKANLKLTRTDGI